MSPRESWQAGAANAPLNEEVLIKIVALRIEGEIVRGESAEVRCKNERDARDSFGGLTAAGSGSDDERRSPEDVSGLFGDESGMGVGGGPRQEFIDARRGPYELFKHVRAIGFGIGAVEAAGFDQGGKASPGFRAFIAPGE